MARGAIHPLQHWDNTIVFEINMCNNWLWNTVTFSTITPQTSVSDTTAYNCFVMAQVWSRAWKVDFKQRQFSAMDQTSLSDSTQPPTIVLSWPRYGPELGK